jgi:hypothetical protein
MSISSKLKGSSIRSFFGCNISSKRNGCNVVSFHDSQLVYAVGSKIALLDYHDNRAHILSLPHQEFQYVYQIKLSSDLKYIAIAIQSTGNSNPSYFEKKCSMLIYDADTVAFAPTKPVKVEYILDSANNSDDFKFSNTSFSECSSFVATTTTYAAVGILIYSRSTGVFIQRIESVGVVSHVSFNPMDPTRLCATGKLSRQPNFTSEHCWYLALCQYLRMDKNTFL